MPRSARDRTKPKVVEAKDPQVEAAQRAARTVAAQPEPKVYAPIVRLTVEGEGQDAPTYGDPVPVPPWCEFFAFSIVSQSGPGAVVLQGSNDLDAVEWAAVPYQRPPKPGPAILERQATSEERRSAIHNTRMTVKVPLPGPPSPRFPQWVRVAALVSVNADTVIEFREGA